jgi:hypothetical protein
MVPEFSLVDSAVDPQSIQIARLSIQSSELVPPAPHRHASAAPAPFGSRGVGGRLVCGRGWRGEPIWTKGQTLWYLGLVSSLYAWTAYIKIVIFCVGTKMQ